MSTEHRGRLNHCAGHAAELQIADHYLRRGYAVVGRRWRGSAGEIDLIARNTSGLVFVEVKRSSSLARAADRLGRPQMRRICAAAEEYLAGTPGGQLTDMRIDVALVAAGGEFRIVENAFGQH